MKGLLQRLRRAEPVPSDGEPDSTDEDLPPIASASQQLTSTVTAKAVTVALVVCLAAGPVAAVLAGYATLRPANSATKTSTAPSDETAQKAIVSQFAEQVTVAWLTATSSHPDELLRLVRVDQDYTLPRQAFTVTNPSVARLDSLGGGAWSVTIAATVTDARRQTARRFYQLPVSHHSDGTIVALALPSPVSPPTIGTPPKTEYRTELPAGSPAALTVAQFLSAYLAGAGDLSRYVSPGVTMTALQPAPYTAVRLTELRTTTETDLAVPKDGQQIQVLADADLTVTDQQIQSTNYTLTLTGRGGRWEISTLDPAPVTADPASSVESSPDGSTPTPTS